MNEPARARSESELVISYVVGRRGSQDCLEYKRLHEALKEGCRVVDIIATPARGGGELAQGGFVCVTVLLERPTAYGQEKYIHRRR